VRGIARRGGGARSYSWTSTTQQTAGPSTGIAAPTSPGSYTVSLFIVGPECGASQTFTEPM